LQILLGQERCAAFGRALVFVFGLTFGRGARSDLRAVFADVTAEKA